MLAPAQKESAQLQPKDSSHICRLCKLYCTSKPQNVLCHKPYSDNYIPTRVPKPVGHDLTCHQPAARLTHFRANWQAITQGHWVLQAIQGYCLDLLACPTQLRAPSEIHLPQEERALVSQEITKLLEKGAITQAPSNQPGFISQLFLVPKKGGGQRPVINLKALNRFIRWEHFQMEGLHMLPDVLETRDWLVKADLKYAYLQVPIHPEHHKLLQFQWEGVTYNLQCLPFGLSSAPRVFTKIMRPIVGFLRQIGIRLLIYLDDMLIMHQERDTLRHLVGLITQLLQALGLVVNNDKSILDPSHSLEFLVFSINTVLMQIHLPREKMRKLEQEARSLLTHKLVSVRELASFIGKASGAIQIAPLHYRALQRMVNTVIPFFQSQEEIQRKYSTVLSLTAGAQEDLTWWTNQAAKSCIAPIPTLMIESDASNMGWGTACQNERTGGLWSRKEALHHINYLELLAAFLALKSFIKGREDQIVLLKMDNITALTYINKMGGAHSHLLCSLAVEMWSWCLRRNISVMAEHLPGVKNLAADSESRTIKDRCDWMLNPQVFSKLNRVMGPLEIDLFASRLTHQVPLWRTQPWFPVLIDMLEDYPRILPRRADLTLNPTGQKFIMNRIPTLVAWPICGSPSSQEAFRTQLRNSCFPPGEQRQPPITTPCLTSGLAGVSRGIEIPLRAL